MAAEVIQFPLHRRSPTAGVANRSRSGGWGPNPTQPADVDPNLRLQRALAGLEAALAAQSRAIAEWRASLGRLKDTVGGLGDGLRRYDGSLGRLQAGLVAANGEARRLEAWADSVLAEPQQPPADDPSARGG